MLDILILLKQSLLETLLVVDNALYMTSAVEGLQPRIFPVVLWRSLMIESI